MKPIDYHKLDVNQQKSIRWGSHIPLNKALLQTFPITGVLELGAGFNSTPLFFDKLNYVVSIESDKEWITNLLKTANLSISENKKILYHQVPNDITRSTLRPNISNTILNDAVNFYKCNSNKNLNYLFIDQYAGFRYDALQNMYDEYDIIAYHDVQEKNVYAYESFTLNKNTEYYRFIHTSFAAYTGVLISKKFNSLMCSFFDELRKESNQYSILHNVKMNDNMLIMQY